MRLLVAGVLLFFSTAVYSVAVDEKPIDDPAKEAIARELMKEIRCLVCQNQSIEDSNAELAKDLRMIVRERVAIGDTPENVRAYLVDRYGDWVLLEPPVKKSTWLLWASPFLFLGLVFVGIITSKKKKPVETPLTDEEKARLEQLLGEREA